jgi:hypothetical protein
MQDRVYILQLQEMQDAVSLDTRQQKAHSEFRRGA